MPPIFSNFQFSRDAAQVGGKRDTPIDYKLAHLHSQLSYAPIRGSVWNRKGYYTTVFEFVKHKYS